MALGSLLLVLPLWALAAAGTLFWVQHPSPGFFVMRNGVVPTIGLPWWTGIRAGIPFHGRVVAVDGQPVTEPAQIYRAIVDRPVGTVVRYTVTKNGVAQDFSVPTQAFSRVDYWLSVGVLVGFGLLAVVLSASIGLLQPGSDAVRAFVLQGGVTALFAITGTMLYHPDLWWASPLHLVTQAAVPAALLHLGLRFPTRHPLVVRGSAWRWLPWGITAALIPWMIVEFNRDPPETSALYLSYYYTVAAILGLVALVATGHRYDGSTKARQQREIVAPGLVFGLAVSVVGFVDIARHGGRFPIQFIAPFPLIFYLSVAAAIAWHDLFDIDRHLKRVLVYAVLTLGIALGYAGLTAVASLLGGWLESGLGGVATVGFLLAGAVFFEPMRWRLQRVVDRLFNRGRPDFRETVKTVSAALTALLDTDDILTRVGRTVHDAFVPEWLRAEVWMDGVGRAWAYQDGRMVEEPPSAEPSPLRAPLAASGGEVVEVEGLPGSALAVPLSLGGTVVGSFLLGPRQSGLRYGLVARELVATLAAQTAIALANARSYHHVLRANAELEARVQTRTAELERSLAERDVLQLQMVQQEKLAALGVLVAGVAHEINNPVSFIVGTVPPLQQAITELQRDYGSGPAEPVLARAREMVDVIADGASRTAGIVRDLRQFSRVGEAEPRLMDLRDTIDVVLRLTRPQWADRITIERRFADLPPVEASPEQMSQVIMNLIANACDAIPERGTIWITGESTASGVVMTVRDDGEGIPPDRLSRIFDPFFTTKAVGKGTGLGLAISQRIVVRHGGRLEATSTPGVGSEFRLTLPLRMPSAGSPP